MHFYTIKNGQKNANTFNEFFKSFFVDLNEQVPAVPAGFQWIKMGSMYRCAGGSHCVAESQLGL